MPKKGKTGKNRQDKFYHLAKEQGFRSRAAFKLVQLNKRFDFLSSASNGILDLCAAPGGWMQIARKHMPLHAPCIGVDLVPIRAISGCISLVGDITKDTTRSEILRTLRQHGPNEKVDVVLSDGSPNMGKAWLQDAYTQSELSLAALKVATDHLVPGGTFITKVFRSNDYNSLLFVMHQLFTRVDATKPSASRAESAEIYVMCLGYKAPKNIDNRLLSPKHVFKDLSAADPIEDDKEKPDVFLNTVMKDMKKQKRHRGGYEDGAFTMFKKVSILEFCQTTRPVALMVEVSQFSFEPHLMEQMGLTPEVAKRTAAMLEMLSDTSSELLSCCEDLKVLARREFKLLLKWRAAAREGLLKADMLNDAGDEKAAESTTAYGVEDGAAPMSVDGGESSEGEELESEFQQASAEARAAAKRKERKARKSKSAIQRKIDMKIIMPDEAGGESGDVPESLFQLSSADKAKNLGVAMADVSVDVASAHQDEGYEGDQEEANAAPLLDRQPSRLEEVTRAESMHAGEIMEDLDRWYNAYITYKKKDKNGILLEASKERKRHMKRQSNKEAGNDAVTSDGGDDDGATTGPKLVVDSSDSDDDDGDMGKSLNVGGSDAQSREALLWFSQPMFQDAVNESSSDEGGSGDDHMNEDTRTGRNNDGVSIVTEKFDIAAQREADRMAHEAQKKRQVPGEEFEIAAKVTEPDSDSNSDSFHSSDYDTDEKAEMVAVGKKMRESKRGENGILDDAYHRYTFDDPMELPRWFADQDGTYRDRKMPVSKEDVDEMKEYIKSLNAAPTKKEAEAKARKRLRMAKKMEAMKVKANSIADQADMTVNARMKAIEDVYKQAMKKGKSSKRHTKKVYQVMRPNGKMTVGKEAGKGRGALRGARMMTVDRRQKSDKRGIAKAENRAKGKKK